MLYKYFMLTSHDGIFTIQIQDLIRANELCFTFQLLVVLRQWVGMGIYRAGALCYNGMYF